MVLDAARYRSVFAPNETLKDAQLRGLSQHVLIRSYIWMTASLEESDQLVTLLRVRPFENEVGDDRTTLHPGQESLLMFMPGRYCNVRVLAQ